MCNCATHKKFSQEILLYPGLSDFTNSVLDVQSGPDFDTGFNLVSETVFDKIIIEMFELLVFGLTMTQNWQDSLQDANCQANCPYSWAYCPVSGHVNDILY